MAAPKVAADKKSPRRLNNARSRDSRRYYSCVRACVQKPCRGTRPHACTIRRSRARTWPARGPSSEGGKHSACRVGITTTRRAAIRADCPGRARAALFSDSITRANPVSRIRRIRNFAARGFARRASRDTWPETPFREERHVRIGTRRTYGNLCAAIRNTCAGAIRLNVRV